MSSILKSLPNAYQPWARYLEGDNISTKIGSGRVEFESGEAFPTFKISEANPTFSQKSGRVGISSTFPDFRLKSRGESRFDLDLSRLLSRLFEEIGQKSRGESRFGLDLSRLLSRLFEEVWAPRSRCEIEIEMKKKSRSRFSVEIGEASPILLAHSWVKLMAWSRASVRVWTS